MCGKGLLDVNVIPTSLQKPEDGRKLRAGGTPEEGSVPAPLGPQLEERLS